MALEVDMRKLGRYPVVAISGRAVDVDVKKLAKKIDALYRRNFPKIVIDVTNTDFIDSHGLGTVVYYHTLMQKEKRELIILNTNPNPNSYLNRLFELTHLDRVLRIVQKPNDVLDGDDGDTPFDEELPPIPEEETRTR
jgi:anti-anti-sigma factor